MNGITHFATGVVIQLGTFALTFAIALRIRGKNGSLLLERHEWKVVFVAYAITAVFAFFSHNFTDALARYTYHDSSVTKWDNPFYGPWTYSMLAAAALFGLFAIIKDPRLAWGMAFALLPDLLDYSTFRVIEEVIIGSLVSAGTISLPTTEIFTFSVHSIGNFGSVFNALDVALFGHPISLNQNPLGTIPELSLISGLLVAWHYLAKVQPQSRRKWKRPPPVGRKIILFLLFALWLSTDVWVGLFGAVPGGFGPVLAVSISFSTVIVLLVVLSRRRSPLEETATAMEDEGITATHEP